MFSGIRDYLISKSMCFCGGTNVLADDLLPNNTVRATIVRILESNNSSGANSCSTSQPQGLCYLITLLFLLLDILFYL